MQSGGALESEGLGSDPNSATHALSDVRQAAQLSELQFSYLHSERLTAPLHDHTCKAPTPSQPLPNIACLHRPQVFSPPLQAS